MEEGEGEGGGGRRRGGGERRKEEKEGRGGEGGGRKGGEGGEGRGEHTCMILEHVYNKMSDLLVEDYKLSGVITKYPAPTMAETAPSFCRYSTILLL